MIRAARAPGELLAVTPQGSALVALSIEDLRGLVILAAEQATRTCLAALTTAAERGRTPNDALEQDEPLPDGWPLAELAAARRAELCLSLAEVARRMHRAAAAEQDHCGITRQAIGRIERERRIPHPSTLRWLAAALELPRERLLRAARQQRRKRFGFSQEALAQHLGVERST